MIRRICFAVLVISVVTVSQHLAGDDLKTYMDVAMVCDDDCKNIGMYLTNSDGKLNFETIEECGDGFCSCSNGQCTCDTKIGNCAPTYDSIICGTKGKFPHLTNCSQYYECSAEDADPVLQPCEGYIYNPCTEECDIDIDECPDTTKACTKAGDLKVIKENQRIYYLCVIEKDKDYLIPEMFRCATGFFDVSAGSCVKDNSAGCVKTDSVSPITISPSTSTQASISSKTDSSTSSTNASLSPNTDSPTTSTQASLSPNTDSPTTSTQTFTECTQYGYFEDHNDRHRYYFCDAVLHKFHYTCPTKRCFDPNSGKCVKDSC